MTTQHVETLIVGAGQAGLATGYHLARLGRGFLIVDGSGRRATTGAATTTRSGPIRRRGSTDCRAWSSRGIRDTSQARTRLRTSSSSTPWRWSYRCECRLGWIDTYPETVVDSPPTWGPRRSSATAQWSPPGHSAASRGCWRWPRRCPPGSGSSTPRRPDTGLPEVSSSREPVARAENRYSGQVGVMPGKAGHIGSMRIRDHNKGDLGLAALTLTVAAAAAGSKVLGWVRGRLRRRRRSDGEGRRFSKRRRHS